MKKLIKNSLFLACFVAAVAMAYAYLTGDMSLSDMLFGTGFSSLAMAVPGSANLGNAGGKADGQDGVGAHITGKALFTSDTKQWSPDLIESPIDRDIVKMYQQSIPIDQMLRYMKAVPTKGMDYEYYSIDTRPIKGVVSANSTFTGANGAASFNLSVVNPYIFNVGDTVRVSKFLGWDKLGTSRTNGIYLTLYVVGRDSQKLVCQVINGPASTNNTTQTIAKDTVIWRVASAAHEGDVQTAAYSALPTKAKQNMQIFKSQTMETRIHADSQKEVDWTATDQDEYMLFDFRRQIEAAFIFGVRGNILDVEAQRQVLTCAGMIQQICESGADNIITFEATGITDDVFIDWTKKVFVGNNGSHERLVFVGSELMAYISKLDYVQRQIDANSSEVLFGYTWQKIVTNFGVLKFYMHPLFDEFGFSNCAIIIDPQYVSKRVFRSIEQDQLELTKAGVFDGRAKVVTEISSVVLKYPKCHKLLVPEGFLTDGTYGEDTVLQYVAASDDDSDDDSSSNG